MNLDKLDAAIAHIEAHPEEFRQRDWFYRGDGGCGTSACIAGTIALLDGWTPGDWRPDEDAGGQYTAIAVKAGREELVSFAAAEALDADHMSLNALFDAANSLDDIKRIRDEYAAEIGAGPGSTSPEPAPEGGA